MNFKEVAERTGLEPATPCVTGRYSNQLNYHTECVSLPLDGCKDSTNFLFRKATPSASPL